MHGVPHPADPHAHGQAHKAQHDVSHGLPTITPRLTTRTDTATGRGTGRTNRRRPMTLPLMALAVGAIVAGFLSIPPALGGGAMLEHFLEPSFTAQPRRAAHAAEAGGGRRSRGRGSG